MPAPQRPGGARFATASRIMGGPHSTRECDGIGQTLAALLRYNQATLGASPHPLKVGSCVQDCVVVQQVLLQEFGIFGQVVCADLCAWNHNFRCGVIAGQERHEPRFKRHRAPPYSVEVCHGMSNPTNRYAGHAVIRTAHYTVDPTVGQVWRVRGGRLLLDPPPVIVYENSRFKRLDTERDAWLTRPRIHAYHSNGSSAQSTGKGSSPDRLYPADLGPLLRNYGPGRDQVAVLEVGSDCWIAALLRPDLRIQDTYARWDDAGFRGYSGEMAQRIRAIIRRGS